MLGVDVFSGCGGLTSALQMSRVSHIASVEIDKSACLTAQNNFESDQIYHDDIYKIDLQRILLEKGIEPGRLDILTGGPPCQAFSTYGQRDITDPRANLIFEFVEQVKKLKPKIFLMENVQGLVSMLGGSLLKELLGAMNLAGYHTIHSVEDAVNYGVPQFRKRLIIIGFRFDILSNGSSLPDAEFFFSSARTHCLPRAREIGQLSIYLGEQLLPFNSVKDAISDLVKVKPLPPTGSKGNDFVIDENRKIYNHSCKRMLLKRRLILSLIGQGEYGAAMNSINCLSDQELQACIEKVLSASDYSRSLCMCRSQDRESEKKIQESLLLMLKNGIDREFLGNIVSHGGFKNKFRRLDWFMPSHTLVAHMARDCSDFIHPMIPRFISVREAARLQSFSDEFIFVGSQFQQLKQIGNAVPPLMLSRLISHAFEHVGLTVGESGIQNQLVA